MADALQVSGIDWGASTEHPFVVTWACYDGAGEWLTYDEYWCNQQDKTLRRYLKPDLVIIDDMGLKQTLRRTPAGSHHAPL